MTSTNKQSSKDGYQNGNDWYYLNSVSENHNRKDPGLLGEDRGLEHYFSVNKTSGK